MEPEPQGPVSLPAEALAALHNGNKIEAIKLVRQSTGLGLKEAKDRVEAYLAGEPALQVQYAASQSRSKTGCLLALVAILAVLAFLFLKHPGK